MEDEEDAKDAAVRSLTRARDVRCDGERRQSRDVVDDGVEGGREEGRDEGGNVKLKLKLGRYS